MSNEVNYGDIIKESKYKYYLKEEYNRDIGENFKRIEITSDFICLHNSILTVKKSYAWDELSGPTVDSDDTKDASLVHDALYQLMRECLLPRSLRKAADQLLYDLLIANGVSRIRAWYMYHGVRIFGGRHTS